MRAGVKAAAVVAILAGVGLANAAAPRRSAVSGDIPVLVLGTYHMGNPGRDLHNAQIDPVTTPAKQAELAALAKRLAAFRPTVIAVEQASDAVDLADPGYAKFTPSDLTRKRTR